MNLLDVAVYGAFLTALASLPFALVGGVRFFRNPSAKASNFPFVSAFLVLAPLIAVSIYTTTVKESDRQAIVQTLNSIPPNGTVLIDGRPAKDSEALIAALKGVRLVGAHHSHPVDTMEIVVQSKDASIALTLGRDSQLPQEYWVFVSPLFEKDSSNGIGRITTSLLDSYR